MGRAIGRKQDSGEPWTNVEIITNSRGLLVSGKSFVRLINRH